jgi:predicted lipoprotein with Yx(FWY)xxD motif
MKQFKFITLFSLTLLSVYLSNCKSDPTPAAPKPTGISVSASAPILTDNKNQTLYIFASDANGQSSCTGACEKQWPVFYVENPTVDGSLSSSDFAVITRADNTKQSTYKGLPLYYFSPSGDGKLEAAGQITGDGVDQLWFVAKANYTVTISSEQLVGADGKNYTSAGVEGAQVSSFFVDVSGRTLYAFSNDTQNNNNFTAADLSNNSIWSMFHATVADLPLGVSASDFGEITVFGQQQTTYKGWPLYTFGGNSSTAGDHNRGETRGVSFPSPGIWHVVNSDTPGAPTSINITQNATLGNLLTDSKGRTLYMFTKDTDKTNHFCPTGVCTAVKWPIFYTDVVTLNSSSLSATDFDVITLANGAKQTTYKGWPLYNYAPAGDGVIEAAGSTGGDGFGNGLWFAAKTYSLMVANAQLVGGDGNHYVGESILGDGATFYFVDGNGRTIYRFSHDTHNTNTFDNGTAAHDAIWPVFYSAQADLNLPSSMNKADFAEITVLGQKQLTYKGWPLYYFNGNATVPGDAADAVRGRTRGISFPVTPAPGASAIWRIVFTSTVSN